jgi:hypothetical protein
MGNWYKGCEDRPPAVTNQVRDRTAPEQVVVRLSYIFAQHTRPVLLVASELVRYLLPVSCQGMHARPIDCVAKLCRANQLPCAAL